jgi:hypothetical protein
MGHRHIVKPPEEKKEEEKTEGVAEVAEVAPIIAEPVKPAENLLDIMNAPAVEVVAEKAPEKKAEQKKPELDWFFLRRGKAHIAQSERPPRAQQRQARVEGEEKIFTKPDKKAFPAERYAPKGQKFDKKKSDDAPKFKKKKHDDRKHEEKVANSNPRVFTAEASTSDNPFAVLQNLKLK